MYIILQFLNYLRRNEEERALIDERRRTDEKLKQTLQLTQHRTADRQRARHTDRYKKKKQRKENIGREKHDFRMDGSRSGGETETCGEMDRKKEIKMAEPSFSCAFSTSIFPVVCLCVRVSLRHVHTQPLIRACACMSRRLTAPSRLPAPKPKTS